MAFEPASVKDIQTWSGLVRLKDAIEELKPELRVFRDENSIELFDFPDAPLPPADAPSRHASYRSTTTWYSPTPAALE